MTVLTGAGASKAGAEPSPAEEMRETWSSRPRPSSERISRACGSIFASALITALSDVSSPLLESPASNATGGESLHPAEPTDVQTKTYDEFCKAIINALKSIDRRQEDHEFRSAAEDDEWDLDLDLSNSQSRDGEPGTSHNGGSRGQPQGDSRSDSIRRILQAKARTLSDACPGDWDAAPYRRLQGQLRRYARGESRIMKSEDSFQALIIYRLDAANFIDMMVSNAKLPRPYYQSCLAWDFPKILRGVCH